MGISEHSLDANELADLLTEAVRKDFGTPGWRARAIKAGCLTAPSTTQGAVSADRCDAVAFLRASGHAEAADLLRDYYDGALE